MQQNRHKKLISSDSKSLEMDMRNIQDSLQELMIMVCLRPSIVDFEILSIETPSTNDMNGHIVDNEAGEKPQILSFNNKKSK